MKKNILLSAFAPFGAYPENSSELVAHWLERDGVDGFSFEAVIFPATIPSEDRGEMLAAHARSISASGIVSLGMASEKKGLCIERFATNAINNAKYCPAELVGTRIDPDEEYGKRIALDLKPWRAEAFMEVCWEDGIPVEHSKDAGGFCCNHLAWQTLRALSRSGGHVPYLFLHLPCSSEAIPNKEEFAAAGKVSLTVDQMTRGIELLLRNSRLA